MLIAQHKWMFAAVVCTAALAPMSAYADQKNEIKAVAFSEDNGTTKVILRGAQTPTFTVYKLERPSRVVVDVPQARLAEALRGHEGASVFTPSTWAVSTIAAQQLDDGGQLVRVIVTLARPGRYDVKTEGNEVVVSVTARDPMPPKGANPAELAKFKAESDAAKADANAAKADANAAKADANAAKADAERMRKLAADKQAAAELAMQDSARTKADVERMKADAKRAKADADAAKAVADRAQAEVNRAQADASRAQADASRAQQDATSAKQSAEQAKREAEVAKRDVEQARANAAKATDAATRAKLEAEAQAKSAKADAAKSQAEAAKMRADAIAAREEAEVAKREAEMRRKEAEQLKADAMKSKNSTAKTNAEVAQARSEAEAAKADAERARSEAKAARTEADAAKAAAAADKRMAEADRQRAEQERTAAMKLQKDAKTQLAQLDKKTLEVQVLEDKARAFAAAAQVREDSARDSLTRAERERAAAEQAAKVAASARDKSSSMAAAEREKLIAEAKTAEARLAAAKKATADAEARRVAAETAANNARTDLDTARTTLASVEGQRTAAERAASDASRKRGEAEAAASDASRRRTEAEAAASIAASKKTEAERAAREAEVAKVAAEKQRSVAEAAATKAVKAKYEAEGSLEELMAKREAAEKAASDLELRSKQEAKAASDLVAMQQRKASDAELAKVRAEMARLADQRQDAETELADRRKAVASQQAEADRLRTAAAQARDTAEREEKRRATLAAQRATEEEELEKIKAARAIASKPAPATVAVAKPAPAPVAATKPAAKAAFIKDITFKGDASNGRVDLAMTGEGQISLGEVTATYVELIIDNTELAQKLERKLDVSKFGSPVRAVSSYRDRRSPNRVRLVAELAQPATPTIERGATGVVWSFASTQTAQAKPARMQNVPPQVVGGFGAASTPIAQQSVTQIAPQAPRNRKVYRGATVDFDFKNAPMTDLLRTIAETGRVNIVVPQGIDTTVTVRLKKVPWDQALEVILASHGLWYRRDGNLFRIAPRKELDAEDEAEAARREAMIKAESPRSEIIPLNYASAAELKPKLETMLSSKGRLEVDPRTNSLIISDVAGNRAQISQLALSLDAQTPQISIEARIVEARSSFLRQFGIQWGGNATASAQGGNATGLIFPSSVGLRGGADDGDTPTAGVSAAPSDFAVNLPAAVGTGSGGALGLSLGSVAGNFNINLRLSALEDTGTVRIISAPKITVLNHKEAKISQGVGIPISVVSAAGTQTQFVQADLALTVTPSVSQRDCSITMDLQVSKNEPDFVNVGARGDPSILRKEAKTTMLVADGETSVLGGIYTRNSGLAYSKLPFLGDIPVLGWLFKSRRENDDRTEILVFITPKITNRALLRCQQ